MATAVATRKASIDYDNLSEHYDAEYRVLVEARAEGKTITADGIAQVLAMTSRTLAQFDKDVELLKSRKAAAASLKAADAARETIDAKRVEHASLEADLFAFRQEYEAKLEAKKLAVANAFTELKTLESHAKDSRRSALQTLQATCDSSITSRIDELESEFRTVTRKLQDAECTVVQLHASVESSKRRMDAFRRGNLLSTGAESPNEAQVTHAERQRDTLQQRKSDIEAELTGLRQRQIDPRSW